MFSKITFIMPFLIFHIAYTAEGRPSFLSQVKKAILQTPGPLVPWAKQMPIESRYLTRIPFVKGKGPHLWSSDGQKFLDMTAGYGAINLGRRFPKVEQAVESQRQTGLLHLQSDIDHPLRHELNARLLDFSPMDPAGRCFFTVGGSNAVEAAYAIARRAVLRQDPTRGSLIIATRQGYSGASSTLPARITGEDDRRSAFTTLCSQNVVHIDQPEASNHNGHAYIDKILEIGPEKFTAIHLEGGGHTATAGGYHLTTKFLEELFAFAAQHQIPIVDDETYTGFGRTGDRFGISHSGLVPSIMLGSKSITNGEGTLGYVIVSPEIADIYDHAPMDFGLTFYAPLGDAAAALAVIDTFESQGEQLFANSNLMGALLKETLESKLHETSTRAVVRQKGLLLIIELLNPDGSLWSGVKFTKLKKDLVDSHQIITMGRNGKLMLTPAINISEDDIHKCANAVADSVRNIESDKML